VALVFRLITILIAAVGVGYYWTRRREVGDLLREAEQEDEADALDEAFDGELPEAES
jgi:glycosyltransferase 2 family protein